MKTYKRYNVFTNSVEIIPVKGNGEILALISGTIHINDKELKNKLIKEYHGNSRIKKNL